MTIAATPRRSPVYTGNGVATTYAFSFKVLDATTLVVTVADENDLNSAVLVNGVDYTVTLNPDQDASPGGEIGYAGLPVGHRLVITSAVDASQPTAIANLGAFHADVIEAALDRIVIQHQQQQEQLDRCVKVTVTSEQDPSTLLDTALTSAANSASAAAASALAADASADAAATSEANAATSESNASNSAGAAAASAASALASKNAAAASESNAAGSASAAATSASNASTSETNASNSASAAAASETAAEAAQAAAEAALDSFDDRYLGAKASDPTLDNDGNALVEGATYWNSTTKALKVYNGTSWESWPSGYLPKDGSQAMTGALATPMVVTDSPLSFRNKLINGGFDIWQRDTSQTASGYGSDDRWLNVHSGSTKTHSQQTFALGQTDVPGNPRRFSRTVVTSVAGAANYVMKSQRIEAVKTLAGKTVTLSFYAKADSTKNIAVELAQAFGTGGSPSPAVTGIGAQKIALTPSWAKYTVTIAVPSISGKTLGTAGDDNLQVVFWFDAGSNFNSRTDTLGQQSGTFDIANVQVEEGSVATPFEQRPLGLELSLCQRYYQTKTSLLVSGYGSGGSIQYTVVPIAPMRAAPTVTIYYTAQFNAGVMTCPLAEPTTVRLQAPVTALGDFWSSGSFSADAEL